MSTLRRKSSRRKASELAPGAAASSRRARYFQASAEGLPQADCFELIYRHGLAVADDGSSLMMGSTTGSLWSSDDAGERWSSVAAHLPPIYAVRFG